MKNDALKSTYTANWIRPSLLPKIFGITAEAARKYRERGLWLEGKQFKRVGRNYWYSCSQIDAWLDAQ